MLLVYALEQKMFCFSQKNHLGAVIMDKRLVTGQSHVSSCAVWLAGDEIRAKFDFTDCMEYPGVCASERHGCSREK